MATIHMSEAELARDLHSVLARVERGVEVVIERDDHQPIAVLRAPKQKGRLLSECITLADALGSTAILDDEFMADVEKGIAERSKPWNPPPWE